MIKQLWGLLFILLITSNNLFAQTRTLINSNNEFGGKTFQSYLEKRTLTFFELYDINDVKVAEEYLYTEDYPILTDLLKKRVYYKLDKKIKEERFYTAKYTHQSMLKRTINYYDQYSGEKIASENHFSKSYLGYNKILFKNGRKFQIEWYYPENRLGICKKVFSYDAAGKEKQSVVYFSNAFTKENGYYKKVTKKGSSSGRYLRKQEEIIYFTDHYAEQNSDLMKKVTKYTYHPNQEVNVREYYFDSLNEELMYSGIN